MTCIKKEAIETGVCKPTESAQNHTRKEKKILFQKLVDNYKPILSKDYLLPVEGLSRGRCSTTLIFVELTERQYRENLDLGAIDTENTFYLGNKHFKLLMTNFLYTFYSSLHSSPDTPR